MKSRAGSVNGNRPAGHVVSVKESNFGPTASVKRRDRTLTLSPAGKEKETCRLKKHKPGLWSGGPGPGI